MREYLLTLIPPHKTYVEPFAGGLSVLLGKPRTKCEVVNDINEDLVMFFRYVRLHGDALLAEIDSVLAARREFDFFSFPRTGHGTRESPRVFLPADGLVRRNRRELFPPSRQGSALGRRRD